MTRLSHNFEGGTDTVTLAAGAASNTDTPGNDYFDSVQQATGGTSAYSNAHVHSGTMACRFQCAGTAGQNCVRWHEGRRGSLVDDYARAYFHLTDALTLNSTVAQWITSGLANQGKVFWQNDNKLNIRDDAGALIAGPSTTALALGQYHRLEFLFHADTATAQITVRIFAGANVEGTTPTETLTSSTFDLVQGTTDRVLFGLPDSNANQPGASGFLYMDDLVDGASDWVGPVVPQNLPPVPPIMVWP